MKRGSHQEQQEQQKNTKTEKAEKAEKNQEKRVFRFVLISAVILIAGLFVSFYLIQNRALKENGEETGKTETYKKHVAMIIENSSDVFWQSVYEAARDAGMKRDIYIENFGAELNKEYSVEELMEMAIVAKVDGIILETENTDNLEPLINQAAQLKAPDTPIPVITLGRDIARSERKSFISANDYAIGEKYGRQVLQILQPQKTNVTVLLPMDKDNSQPNLVYSGLNEVLEKAAADIQLEPAFTGSEDEFESEENIRDLLLAPAGQRPDIVVCLSAVDTISAYQCVRDYNLVGEVQIIGSYSAPQILEGIEKNIINSTIVINAREMGQTAADSIADYFSEDYVNEYLPVSFELVTSENVSAYMEKDEK